MTSLYYKIDSTGSGAYPKLRSEPTLRHQSFFRSSHEGEGGRLRAPPLVTPKVSSQNPWLLRARTRSAATRFRYVRLFERQGNRTIRPGVYLRTIVVKDRDAKIVGLLQVVELDVVSLISVDQLPTDLQCPATVLPYTSGIDVSAAPLRTSEGVSGDPIPFLESGLRVINGCCVLLCQEVAPNLPPFVHEFWSSIFRFVVGVIQIPLALGVSMVGCLTTFTGIRLLGFGKDLVVHPLVITVPDRVTPRGLPVPLICELRGAVGEHPRLLFREPAAVVADHLTSLFRKILDGVVD